MALHTNITVKILIFVFFELMFVPDIWMRVSQLQKQYNQLPEEDGRTSTVEDFCPNNSNLKPELNH